MLQQTQVATVLRYYERFLACFPNVAVLAAAPLDAVLTRWSGLGYYSRARNLHRCARAIVARHDGAFPRTPDALAALPGIGRSTAAAIAVFAFGARAAILDGNVKRVLARVFDVAGFPGDKRVESQLWALAERLLPDSAAAMTAYTQGLMDLGATLCVRAQPHCARCPFAPDCIAHQTHRQRELPGARPRKTLPVRRTLMLILRVGDAVLLERRPPVGIWGGLWSLPEAPDEALLAARAARAGINGRLVPLLPVTHTFTHFRLEIEPRLIEAHSSGAARAVVPNAAPVAADDNLAWVNLGELDAHGLPAPVRRILRGLRGALL